jgi:hypothetical protein
VGASRLRVKGFTTVNAPKYNIYNSERGQAEKCCMYEYMPAVTSEIFNPVALYNTGLKL